MRALVVRAPGLERETVQAFKKVDLDAEVVCPVELVSLDRPKISAGLLSEYDAVAFTSPRTVEFLSEEEVKELRRSDVDIAAVGPRTREALERAGLRVDVMPTEYTTGKLAEELRQYGAVLALRSRRRTEDLRRTLESYGVKAEELEMYDLKPKRVEVNPRKFDVVCFLSAFTARCFLENVDPTEIPEPVVSIGPVTTKELRRAGLKVVEAEEHTVEAVAKTALRVIEA
ncbi:uroporphyrinogen-III synthase [Methanopyrus kandleri]|uniref:Uroporphyrinogen-III synthase n=2 Tax=Methanopyrus kandleri TaxID=2320 RepID=Q8TV50_METKA|nr:uroporphyrinogen-III synthase [Methanopyrus kandleri]AAM02763.1 Uroporphyrinogen-III synthase [Methanopyrus kandleri AV19]HII71023.1 uroporphyrinogen-III synthase [Methanopyrus kandleri]